MTDTAAERQAQDEVSELLARSSRRRFQWRWVVVAAAAMVVAGWAFVAGRSLGRDPTVVRSALVGKPAPPLPPTALGGGQIDTASWRGQIIVVNFWASWCVPCRQEAPELEAFSRRSAGKGVQLVGIVYSDEESKAADFVKHYQLTYPQALDPGGRTAIDYGVFGVPETYVIDAKGTVMAKLLGAVNADTLSRVVAAAQRGRTVSERNDRYRTAPGP